MPIFGAARKVRRTAVSHFSKQLNFRSFFVYINTPQPNQAAVFLLLSHIRMFSICLKQFPNCPSHRCSQQVSD